MKTDKSIKNEMIKTERTLWTKNENTWCPGCPDYTILISARKAIAKLINEGYKREFCYGCRNWMSWENF